MNITWEEVVAVIAVLTFISGIWWRVEGMCRRNTDDLSAYKLHVSEEYTTKEGLRNATDQIMGAIGGLQASINRIADRVDRFTDKSPRSRASA
jgi:hypothetical protein